MSRLSQLFSSKWQTAKDNANVPPLEQQRSLNNEALILEEFTTKGVAFGTLLILAEALGPKATFHDAKKAILKRTKKAEGQRSFASYLCQHPETTFLVGKAEYFVSYAWSGSFHATVQALSTFFEKHNLTDPFIWMDILMVDQHAATSTDIDFHLWSKTFQKSLKQIGKALLVLTPGEEPIAITRSWCCFEWIAIHQAGIPFEYCVTPADVERLITEMENGMGYADFNIMFSKINVENATAFKRSDQKAILELMREVGVLEVNNMIMLSVKEWLMSVATEGQRRVKEGTKEGTKLINAKAHLHYALVSKSLVRMDYHHTNTEWAAQGDLKQALPLFYEALDQARKVTPEDLTLVGTQLNNLGLILKATGDYDEAERVYREAIAAREKTVGRNHIDVATPLNNLALLLKVKGNYDEAEKLFREVIIIFQKGLGKDHEDLASALNNLAALMQKKGNYDEAEKVYREAITIGEKKLGRDHFDVATRVNNLGTLLLNKGDYDGAEKSFRRVIAIYKKTLGNDHAEVALALNNLGKVLQKKGNYADAEKMFREAILIWKNALGDEHLQVALGLNNLGLLLWEKDSGSKEAVSLGRQAFEIARNALGEDHPTTQQYRSDWA